MSSRHGTALSTGKLIGSGIFNLFGVLWIAGILRPVEIEVRAREAFAPPCSMVFLVLCFMRAGWHVSRLEGFASLR